MQAAIEPDNATQRHPDPQGNDTLASMLHGQALRQPHAPALLAPGRDALSYAGLQAQVQRLGSHLRAMGASPSTRVAVVLPNGPEMAVAFVGVAACAACAPLNPAYQAAEFRFHLQDTRAEMVLMLRSEAGPARQVARELGLKVIEIEVDLGAPAGQFRLGDLGVVDPAAQAAAAPQWGAHHDVALVLHTSGTTAQPKLVPLSQANLVASARNIAAHLGLSAADCCLNVMPLFHIHGLVGSLLASLAGGGSVVCTPGFDDVQFFDWIARYNPSWYSAVPTIHQAVLAQGALYRQKAPGHSFRFVRSSSAALPAATLRRLQALLQTPVVEAYGMTEAAHQMASNAVHVGGQTAGSVGVAAGVQIAILDTTGRHLSTGQPGEVAIRGPGVTRGYENHPQANAEAFHDGWFRTGDLGHLDDQGRLFIAGRLKEIVNRGGEKVSPREVDDALLDHPDVLQAAAFGVPHPSLGEDLAAAVVRRAGASATGADEPALRAFLLARLAGFKVPSQIIFVQRLPTGATGKVQRHTLHHVLAASLTRAFVAPVTAQERALELIFREVLACGPLGVHDNFFAQGGDSLSGARVMARVNRRFGLNLAVDALFKHPSIAELAMALPAGDVGGDVADDAAGGDNVAAASIARQARGGPMACSFSQEALWIVERLLGRTGLYNIAQAVRLTGALDVPALDRAIQALLQRHEVLRTAFEERDGVPMQVAHAHATAPLAVVDAADVGTASQETSLLQRLSDDAQKPFGLTRAPLLRASLWCLDKERTDHVLLLVVHHLVADGWSMQVIARELSALYSAFSGGPALAPAPATVATTAAPLPIQFADWAISQRNLHRNRPHGPQHNAPNGPPPADDLVYWRGQLAGLAPLNFPTDRPRPPQLSPAGRSEHFTVAAPLLHALQALALEHNATLFMLLLAAFKVVLMRYCQQDDVAVGSPVAGRGRPELEGAVGYFVNSVVLRNDLSGNPRFTELLGRVRHTALDAYTHQDLPFDHLVAELSPQRDLSRNPLYQVSFALNNQPAPAYAFAGLAAQALRLPTQTAKFDLSLSFVERDGGLQGAIDYSTDLFEPGTVQRLATHVQNVLASVATNAGQRIAHLPLMASEEWHRMRVDWNATDRPYAVADAAPGAAADLVHTRVEQQAARTPHAVALVFNDQRLSYHQLNTQANQLAHHLRRLGVGPEVRVAVCMARSLHLVVAVLAVLKAGGALVPLDPELPPKRLAFMLQDTAARVVLTQASLAAPMAQATEGLVVTVLCVDSQWAEVAESPPDNPACLTTPTHLAGVIYTSGSTGQPKGVLLEHGGWNNHVRWMQQTLRVGTEDRFLHITSLGFDAAMVELFMPLQAGAALVLAAPGEQRDMARLAQLMQDHGVTVLQMVPSALRSLLAEPHFAGGALRYVVCGGEALDIGLAHALQHRLPRATLGNFYGPTETSIDATHFELPPALDRPGSGAPAHSTSAGRVVPNALTVPIGRPIANTQCYVLGRHREPVPVGVTGELFIGGAGLARGYLNQPALTAEHFVAHPFSAGQRLYRTGDLARFRADGNIELLGRSDFQVKLRGHRIELGEIEAALRAVPGVHDGVVTAREDVPGLRRLVAYVVGVDADPNAGTSTDTSAGIDADITPPALKAALARQLPEAWVPSAFVVLPRLPTLPNGKLDRNALPAPHRPTDPQAAPAARTATEQAVWQIWHDVLQLEHFGVHDNFFELGGHSLLATQVLARLRAGLHIELPLRAMFEHPTLGALAAQIDQALAHRLRGDANDRGPGVTAMAPSAIPKIGRDGPLAVSYSQRRMWLVQTLNPQTTAYNMTLGLRLLGPLNADALTEAIHVVVQRHEAFRTRFGTADGEVVQWTDPPHRARIERVDLRHLPAEQREAEAQGQREQLASRRFDLSASGLYRISLLHMAEVEHVLLWVNHHAIGDHWSDGILLRDMGQAYAALCQGTPPALPPRQIEYADYAAWQRADAQYAQLAPQMAYWQRRLQGIKPLPLPHDLAWRELPSGRGSSVSARLPAATFESLRRLSSRHGVTPFMAMLACFKVVLWRYSGQTDMVVGSPVANRTRVESEGLVGTLVNTLVMRTDLSGNPSLAELLARVKETALQAFAHQDAPFERLVEEIEFDRSSNRQPLVQVLFNVINAPFDVKAMAGVTLESFKYTSVSTQFELGLTVDETFGGVHLTYSTDLFVAATAERMLASFLKVLGQLLADPTQTVQAMDSMGAAEHAELARWNATHVPFETGLRLGDLIRRQVRSTGDAVAVVFEGQPLSYRALDASACALALQLRAAGAGPGSRVGVCLERGIELVTALLGVVYSGAAYVPLDPSYPRERLARMCEDAGLMIVVSRAAELQRVGAALPDGVHIVHIDKVEASAVDPRDFELIGTPDDPAYTIFTSGSTGRPKGAMNAHKGIVNRLQWMQQAYPLTPADRVMQKTPYSFDVSVWEFFWPLATGGAFVVARPDGHRDSAYLVDLIRQQGVTVLHFVPSMLRIFLQEPGLAHCGSVRRVVCSGEALPADVPAQFFQRMPHSRLCNLYGPTEAAVDVTFWECQPDAPPGAIPIGRPIANTQVHVLDAHLKPLPVGVPGELYIGGVQVGMGYVSRPDLTAERFIPDPFNPGARLYKTGDLARWLNSGVVDYLGRSDDQVKLSGHRIELGEIETHLSTHPGVAGCVVVVREDTPGDRRLVAYVVGQAGADGGAPDITAVREHLRASLPEFMLPQHVVPIHAVPLLPNGKRDRHALPKPSLADLGQARPRDHSEAPQTDAEEGVAQVWREVLGLRHISRQDNFFDLGGHSLLAMRAAFLIEQRCGLRLDLRRLVHDTLAQLAAPGATPQASAPGHPPPVRGGLVGRILGGIGLGGGFGGGGER